MRVTPEKHRQLAIARLQKARVDITALEGFDAKWVSDVDLMLKIVIAGLQRKDLIP